MHNYYLNTRIMYFQLRRVMLTIRRSVYTSVVFSRRNGIDFGAVRTTFSQTTV